jgi:uncharacterized membrane protein YedE/YeeE
MVGIGMATTGACPGTVIVQVATGIESGTYVALGGILGGILYVRFGSWLKQRPSSDTPTSEYPLTIDSKYNLKPNTVLLTYEVICLTIIAVSLILGGVDSKSVYLHPVAGGILISLAQAASILLSGRPVGVSTAYAEAGELFWRIFSSKGSGGKAPEVSAMVFAAGIFAGSFSIAKYLPMDANSSDISALRAIFGGCIMIVGSRLAGGCTSGHGISGMSAFSVSSVITVASMFAGGIAIATILD